MSNGSYLLTDDKMITFIIRGYHIVEPDLPEDLNKTIYNQLERLIEDPGDALLDMVPEMYRIYEDPQVAGVLSSLLGEDYEIDGYPYCHINPPGTRSQGWYKKSAEQPPHQLHTVLVMYYPQDVSTELGPTVIMPGTHFRVVSPDNLATYGSFQDQVVLSVKAGTVVITHGNIWFTAAANRGKRTRYMVRTHFSRTSDLIGPTWDHTPDESVELLSRFESERACLCSQSDQQKESELRMEMWHYLMGTGEMAEEEYESS